MRRMTMVLFGWLLIVGGLLVPTGGLQAEDAPPAAGGMLPHITLPVPDKVEEQQYLGVSGKGTFTLPGIRAELVIVEIFSMYCPFCQKEAPVVNDLYRLIDQDKDLKEKIKLVGIGVGNSPFEVNTFRNAYAVPFPLLADPDFAVHNALGKVRTPYFIVLKISKDGSHKVVYSRVGSIGEPQAFLQAISR